MSLGPGPFLISPRRSDQEWIASKSFEQCKHARCSRIQQLSRALDWLLIGSTRNVSNHGFAKDKLSGRSLFVTVCARISIPVICTLVFLQRALIYIFTFEGSSTSRSVPGSL